MSAIIPEISPNLPLSYCEILLALPKKVGDECPNWGIRSGIPGNAPTILRLPQLWSWSIRRHFGKLEHLRMLQLFWESLWSRCHLISTRKFPNQVSEVE